MADLTTAPTASDDEDGGGDQACWLNLVCEVCGALNERDGEACWRCDIPIPIGH